ncbi:MAG: site-specific integrase [Planctomycetes bacterium]|nr:site-specific integrase [Planctomycetota bacterium]
MAIRKLKRGWQVDFYDDSGIRHREGRINNRRSAEELLAKRKIEVFENKFDIQKDCKLSLSQLSKRYIEEYAKPNKKSWNCDEYLIYGGRGLLQRLGNKLLSQITVSKVEKLKAKLSEEVSPATVNHYLACLKTMLNKAIDWGLIKENPVRRVKLLKLNNERQRFLSEKEYLLLRAHSPEHLKNVIDFAVNTGMRWGELRNITWGDIDSERDVIIVRESKNNTSREIPINSVLRDVIAHIPKSISDPYVLRINRRRPGEGTRWKGAKPLGSVKTAFNNAVKKAGIKDFKFHDLRHTFASWCVMRGVDLVTLRQLLGHKSVKMVFRYAHLAESHKKEAVERLCRKTMDTFWTHSQNPEKRPKRSFDTTPLMVGS